MIGDVRVAALVRSLAHDLGRIGAAFFAALALWFFVGQKVETDDSFPVSVIAVYADEAVPAQGLVIRVPRQFVIEDVSTQRLNVRVKGKREELDRLRQQLTAFYNVPSDFCGEFVRARKPIDVGGQFLFSGFRSLPSLRVIEATAIQLGLGKRASARFVLSADHVELTGETLPPDVTWSVSPSSVELSGTQDVVQRLSGAGAKLRIRLGRNEVAEAMKAPFSFGDALVEAVDASGPIGNVDFENPEFIELRITRTVSPRVVRLENVPIGWLNLKSAWREGVDPENPLRITPDSVAVELTVSGDLAGAATLEDDLRKRLNVFVDLREMGFTVEAGSLPLHAEGLPAGVAVRLDKERVDVEWIKKEPAKAEGGNT